MIDETQSPHRHEPVQHGPVQHGPVHRGGDGLVALGPALLAAADWFNDAFAEALVAAGWPRLSRSQAQVLLRIDPDGNHPAELARRLQMTRQSMRELLQGLESHGLVERRPHPDDGRSQLVSLTPRAAMLGMTVGLIQVELDAELGRRIGADNVVSLKRILALDWGVPPVP